MYNCTSFGESSNSFPPMVNAIVGIDGILAQSTIVDSPTGLGNNVHNCIFGLIIRISTRSFDAIIYYRKER